MPTSDRPLRFVLLQVRNDSDPVKQEELGCFANQMGVDRGQIQPVDVLTRDLDDRLTEHADAILVGGSGEYSVLDEEPRVRAMVDYLGAAAEAGFPTFASCFGFQALTMALGGEVIADPARAEVGTFELNTTPAASGDPIFDHLPTSFFAQEGHKDRATRLPDGATCLATSERTPFQAFRWRDHDVWATQFHPEMTDADNRLRVHRYASRYKKESEEALASSQPSPEACRLLRRFVALLESKR